MDLELTGKRGVVTGGSRGIGLAVARALAAEGCDVALVARDAGALAAARAAVTAAADGLGGVDIGASISIGRIVTADEVASVVTFLASPKSVAINGDAISVGGGAIGPIYY